jgi:hypothetical protein
VGNEHPLVVAALLEQLAHEKKAVQKKATSCLGAAAVVLPEPLLNQLVESLLASTQSSKADVRVLITAIGQVTVYIPRLRLALCRARRLRSS